MPEDQNKTFDFNKPGQAPPHAAGRPVIVGHHPVMADPMLRPMQHTPPTQPAQPQPVYPPLTPSPTSQPQPPAIPPAGPQMPPQPPAGFPQPATQPAPSTGFEPIGDIPPAQSPVPPQAVGGPQLPPQQMAHHELPIAAHHKKGFGLKKILLWVVLPILALVILFYLLIDAGVINSNINLPFHVFKQKTTGELTSSATQAQNAGNPSSSSNANPVPPGFSAYKDSGLPFSFNYPTLWGTPTVVTEKGYTKRGGSNKADGTYAYLVNFASNKDVQIAVTSAKYLPPARGILYYDFLNWCLSQTDNKYYKSLLTFTTANGVDTPSSVTCNQGPLTDAVVVDTSTIVQRGTKAADGASLGDVYTKNLTSSDIPVVRIKDATSKNGDNIKIILNTNQAI